MSSKNLAHQEFDILKTVILQDVAVIIHPYKDELGTEGFFIDVVLILSAANISS